MFVGRSAPGPRRPGIGADLLVESGHPFLKGLNDFGVLTGQVILLAHVLLQVKEEYLACILRAVFALAPAASRAFYEELPLPLSDSLELPS